MKSTNELSGDMFADVATVQEKPMAEKKPEKSGPVHYPPKELWRIDDDDAFFDELGQPRQEEVVLWQTTFFDAIHGTKNLPEWWDKTHVMKGCWHKAVQDMRNRIKERGR